MRTATWRLFAMILVGLLASAAAAKNAQFRSAKPIWPKNRETGNESAGRLPRRRRAGRRRKVVLRVAAATIYRAWVNGQFVGCGPARGPHGYFRRRPVGPQPQASPGKNVVALEVAGYNANSYYLLDQPSSCKRKWSPETRLASTGGERRDVSARVLDYRVQKVQRYSFQRPFTEVYRLTPDDDRGGVIRPTPAVGRRGRSAREAPPAAPGAISAVRRAAAARILAAGQSNRWSAKTVERPLAGQHRPQTEGISRTVSCLPSRRSKASVSARFGRPRSVSLIPAADAIALAASRLSHSGPRR